ncbi:DUF2807 domain-containing protein [Cryomorphaceae bacterium 1068]|nr:DUF2807 domain-containing protein [Cryomorphaceae bacterium 1068]
MRRLYYILLLIVFWGCSKDEELIRTFDLDAFNKIEFNDSFKVRFHTSDEFKIVANGSERFIEDLEVISTGDSVVIENKVKAAWLWPESNKVILDVYCDSLAQIKASESCTISSIDTLRSDNLLLIVSSKLNIADLKLNCREFSYYNNFPCGGVMTFSGKADKLDIFNYALMQVEASDLSATRVFVENHSGASCAVKALDEFSYSIYNRGDIFLSGAPEVITLIENSGEGELIVVP